MSDVTSYLREEVRKTERAVRVSIIVMSVVLVVFFGYFQWIKGQLAEVITPESIGEFAVNQARAALPEMSQALQANVESQAPHMVRFALSQVVDHVLPMLAQIFETHLAEQAQGVSDIANEGAGRAFAAVLARYKAEHGKGAKKPSAQQLSSFVTAHYGTALDDATSEEMQSKLDKTGSTLKTIDARLSAMASDKAATRQDALGRALISTWWTFLDRGTPKHASMVAGK